MFTLKKTAFNLFVATTFFLVAFGGISDTWNPKGFVFSPAVVKELPPKMTIGEVTLAKIAWCESNNEQFDLKGQPKRGKINPQDVGKYQINEFYHLADSIRLGYDIFTLEGNTGYALHLYKTQGTTPWNWSRGCWGDETRIWYERNGAYWSE